jgi:hypothetical protein
MYFWKTGNLAQDIKEDSISDQGWMKYFLAWMLISTFSQYLMSLTPYEDTNAMVGEMIGIIGVIIFGVSITFKTNLSGSGTAQNYFSRAVALSLPIMIKLLILSIGVGVILGIIEESLSVPVINNPWVMCAFALILETLYFWRINVHLHYINT